jgi:hypothetical protein
MRFSQTVPEIPFTDICDPITVRSISFIGIFVLILKRGKLGNGDVGSASA